MQGRRKRSGARLSGDAPKVARADGSVVDMDMEGGPSMGAQDDLAVTNQSATSQSGYTLDVGGGGPPLVIEELD